MQQWYPRPGTPSENRSALLVTGNVHLSWTESSLSNGPLLSGITVIYNVEALQYFCPSMVHHSGPPTPLHSAVRQQQPGQGPEESPLSHHPQATRGPEGELRQQCTELRATTGGHAAALPACSSRQHDARSIAAMREREREGGREKEWGGSRSQGLACRGELREVHRQPAAAAAGPSERRM